MNSISDRTLPVMILLRFAHVIFIEINVDKIINAFTKFFFKRCKRSSHLCVVLLLFTGRPAILYKSLPSLVLPPAADDGKDEARRQKMLPAQLTVTGSGTAVIPLKETLARRLSSSMDCIDTAGATAGSNDEKRQAAAAADGDDDDATARVTSETQLNVVEPGAMQQCNEPAN